MNYIGKGLLIGYKTYKKENQDKHIYYVLNGDKDHESGLYTDCELITIIQNEQTLEEIKSQNVSFEIASQNYGGTIKQRFLNIQSVKEEV